MDVRERERIVAGLSDERRQQVCQAIVNGWNLEMVSEAYGLPGPVVGELHRQLLVAGALGRPVSVLAPPVHPARKVQTSAQEAADDARWVQRQYHRRARLQDGGASVACEQYATRQQAAAKGKAVAA